MTIPKRKKGRTLVVQKQTGKSSRTTDKGKKAMKPGIRESKNGNVYTETRANRSDKKPIKKL